MHDTRHRGTPERSCVVAAVPTEPQWPPRECRKWPLCPPHAPAIVLLRDILSGIGHEERSLPNGHGRKRCPSEHTMHSSGWTNTSSMTCFRRGTSSSHSFKKRTPIFPAGLLAKRLSWSVVLNPLDRNTVSVIDLSCLPSHVLDL